MSKLILAGVSALILACTLPAAPISYTFSGNGTGTMDGSSFTDANFLVTLTGDTADVALFVMRDGSELRLRLVPDFRVLYLIRANGVREKMDLAKIRSLEFLGSGK